VRLVFLGTPEFAVPALEAVVAAGHRVIEVITQPDRPAGRGQQLATAPVKRAARARGLAVYQPERIRHPDVLAHLAALQPTAMVVVGYGQIIPQTIIDIPPLGILNVHASLLPRYRGAAPIQWAVARGETRTGVTTMRIDAGLDTGDILLQRETRIGEEETALELAPRLAAMGAALLVDTLTGWEADTIVPVPQDPAQASYAPLLKKEDGRIDWTWPAREICNRVRGLLPWPGCYTGFRGQRLHVWRARPGEGAAGAAGMLRAIKGRLWVACGEGASVELLEVQMEGRKRMAAAAFLAGQRLSENEVLGEAGI
jgi:methionyl-tRNA formyltransferase